MDILYEDGALLVCEKPPEILSEPDGGGRGREDALPPLRAESL